MIEHRVKWWRRAMALDDAADNDLSPEEARALVISSANRLVNDADADWSWRTDEVLEF
jgi:hypothetical protein